MKFIVNSQVFLRSVQSISGVVTNNNALPILSNYLFIIENQRLTLVASDLETTMKVELELSECDGEASLCVPSKILSDIVKSFPDIPLIFNIDMNTFAVEITAGEGKYKLAGDSAQAYPEIPQVDSGAKKVEMSPSNLVSAINKTIFATSSDNMRPVMTGVLFEFSPEYLTVVATDAHKLVRYRRLNIQSESAASIVLPKKSLMQIKNILGNRKDEINVQMYYNELNVFFHFDNIDMVCRLIDGRYPNYEAVIPKENPNKLQIDRLSLLNAIKRVSLFANQSAMQVRFKISEREVLVSAEDLDYANAAHERLECSFQGEDMEIGFNAKFIIEMLSNIDTKEVRIEMSLPSRAGLIFPADVSNNEEDILALVMPVMLNQ